MPLTFSHFRPIFRSVRIMSHCSGAWLSGRIVQLLSSRSGVLTGVPSYPACCAPCFIYRFGFQQQKKSTPSSSEA
ncbi:hypothetical protein E2C01_058878 [Portunus trituberculatus]|uniref:Uncharacterized protein n=1 Tax=Portunus trituberculatus TaxID=210409 RepID=A0A5B7H6U7_PORTR|nr:hypothetical protein [Portunus trituberculatus]